MREFLRKAKKKIRINACVIRIEKLATYISEKTARRLGYGDL